MILDHFMSKLDTIKEQIGWLKIVFGTLVAADLSVLAWLAQNFETVIWYKSFVALILVMSLGYLIYIVNKNAYRKMKQLEKL